MTQNHNNLLKLPDTKLAKEAEAVMTDVLTGPVWNHSIRSFLLGRAYADKKNITLDEEAFYVAALFHDYGLCAPDTNPDWSFQVNSSVELTAFLTEKDVPQDRIEIMVDAVNYHMQCFPRWSLGPETGLLQVGTWMDLLFRKRLAIWRDAHIIARHYARNFATIRELFLLLKTLKSIPACTCIWMPSKCYPPSDAA